MEDQELRTFSSVTAGLSCLSGRTLSCLHGGQKLPQARETQYKGTPSNCSSPNFYWEQKVGFTGRTNSSPPTGNRQSKQWTLAFNYPEEKFLLSQIYPLCDSYAY